MSYPVNILIVSMTICLELQLAFLEMVGEVIWLPALVIVAMTVELDFEFVFTGVVVDVDVIPAPVDAGAGFEFVVTTGDTGWVLGVAITTTQGFAKKSPEPLLTKT